MTHLTSYILLIVFAIIFGISQCSDDCFYHPGDPGKKCFNEEHAKYTCCPLDYSCEEGKCISLSASKPSNHLPLYSSILIGVGAFVFAAVCIVIIGAIYRHHKQMKAEQKSYNPSTSFSQPADTPSRTSSSVGFRARTSPPEEGVNIQIPSTDKY